MLNAVLAKKGKATSLPLTVFGSSWLTNSTTEALLRTSSLSSDAVSHMDGPSAFPLTIAKGSFLAEPSVCSAT